MIQGLQILAHFRCHLFFVGLFPLGLHVVHQHLVNEGLDIFREADESGVVFDRRILVFFLILLLDLSFNQENAVRTCQLGVKN